MLKFPPKSDGRGGLQAAGVASSAKMTGEGTFTHVIRLPTGGLMSPNVVFDKPEAKFPSNDSNFSDFARLACGSHGKRKFV